MQLITFMVPNNHCITQLMAKFSPIYRIFGARFHFFAQLGPFLQLLLGEPPIVKILPLRLSRSWTSWFLWCRFHQESYFVPKNFLHKFFLLLLLQWSSYDVTQFSNWSLRLSLKSRPTWKLVNFAQVRILPMLNELSETLDAWRQFNCFPMF